MVVAVIFVIVVVVVVVMVVVVVVVVVGVGVGVLSFLQVKPRTLQALNPKPPAFSAAGFLLRSPKRPNLIKKLYKV